MRKYKIQLVEPKNTVITCIKENIKHPTEQVELNAPMISILKS